jgi:hypothetical protein
VTDRGEGAGDERHHLLDGDVIADGAGRLRAVEQVRHVAPEVCCEVWRGGAQVELGGHQRALHGHVLGTCGHHRRQLREQGCRGIAGGGQGFRLRHRLLDLIDRDREVQRLLSRKVPVDGARANARPAGDLVKRDAEALRREHLLRGPKHPLAIAACVSAQLTVTPVSCQGFRWRGLPRLAGHVGTSITGAPHRIVGYKRGGAPFTGRRRSSLPVRQP